MKQHIIILFLFILHFSSWSQKTIKTTTPCNDELLFKTPGRWLRHPLMPLNDLGSAHVGLNQAQVKELTNRLDAVHQLMLKIYPEPMAVDAVWNHTVGYGTFGEQFKYERNSQGILNPIALKEKPVASFYYKSGFFRYYCNPNNSNEMWPGYPGETGTWLWVHANNLEQVAGVAHGEDMTIGGYPLHLRQPLNKLLGDFELLGTESPTLSTQYVRYVIVHRKGILPYIPVTRKQYLGQCIPHLTRQLNQWIKDIEEMPAGTSEEKDYRNDQKKKQMESRDIILKRYQDELEKTTKEGLLDAPAIIPIGIYDMGELLPIFVDEKEGWMLVIENAEYMRKELPKYMPQFFVLVWTWNEWKPQADIAKLIEEKFPFDMLQAMIDK